LSRSRSFKGATRLSERAADTGLPFNVAQFIGKGAMGGLPGRALPPGRQHLATAGVLHQQCERRVQCHCCQEEAQRGTGLGDRLVAGKPGDSRDQEPRRGDR